MAKIRLVMAMTLDGFLPDENDPLIQWVKTDRNGFPYWHEQSSFNLPVGYPMIDLICKKENMDDSFVYLAEISNTLKIGLLQSLLLYNMVDEWILYYLPETKGQGVFLMDKLGVNHWILKSTHRYKNGICRMIYHKRITMRQITRN